MSRWECFYDSACRTATEYESLFHALGEMKTPSKIGFDESGNIYTSSSYFIISAIERFYYGQSRQDMRKKIDSALSGYGHFFTRIQDISCDTSLTGQQRKQTHELIRRNKGLITLWVAGFSKLASIYVGDPVTTEFLSACITYLDNLYHDGNTRSRTSVSDGKK